MLYNRRGESHKAETLLKQVVEAYPDLYEVAYSLGLRLAEIRQYHEAVIYVENAARAMPLRGRIQYNLGLLLQQLKRGVEAEATLLKAMEIEPKNAGFLYALADYYLKRGRFQEAKDIAEQMVSAHPNHRLGQELLKYLKRITDT